uniref:NADH-ubiquinone oxidoreductase chain 4L n=1 Tax=Chiropsalmus quadrumanus TaxID=645347 RepID=G9IT45_9CNID|nr:NADH dehydrogenase subunit 4L [Chiropsalmus quadrumanus]
MGVSLSITLFLVALLGVIVNRSSLILVLMCIELMLLSISIMFMYSFCVNSTHLSLVSIVMIISVAASESAIGLALMVSYFRVSGHITVKNMNLLRG